MKRKELPVGLQTFHTIRKEQGEYYYVDKTDYAYQLARKEGHFFLSRPRRFGKSPTYQKTWPTVAWGGRPYRPRNNPEISHG